MNTQIIRQYRAQAHHLKPVVMIGNKGLTDNVIAELEVALNAHELIKVKIAAERMDRKQIALAIAEKTTALLIQEIGQTAVYYRKAEK